ncbi:MAG: phage holin family protein [Ruminococcus sp.]|jgi:toxin secretion/phage lysis holin|nr:phage holin family protein [Ruminococcus sp.]
MNTGKAADVLQSVIFGIGAFCFGEFGGLLGALITFIVIDYVTGFAAAAIGKRLSSAYGAKGIAKKISILLIVSLGHILDVNIIGQGDYIMTMAILFYIANEGLSILENAVALGVKVPGKLREVLIQVGDKDYTAKTQ